MGELLLPGRARIVFAQKLTRAHKMETRFQKPWFFKELHFEGSLYFLRKQPQQKDTRAIKSDIISLHVPLLLEE